MSRVYLILSVVMALVALLGGVQWLVGEYRAWSWRRKQTGKWLILIVLCLAPSLAEATCSGSGLAYTCTAGSTAGQINTAIGAASDEAVITLNNGSYTFTGVSLVGKNGITVICESVGGCTITSSDTTFSLDSCSSDITKLVRISGFNFVGTPTIRIWIYCAFEIQKLRIDYNDFANQGQSNIAVFLGEGGSSEPFPDRGHLYGVMDHNNCHATSHNFICMKNTTGGSIWTTGTQGSANALFFEDNICNFGVMGDYGTGCVDNWRAQSTVLRFNTVTGGVLRAHSYCHRGPQSMEVYGNDIYTGGLWEIHMQGSGENMIWGNTLVADHSVPVAVLSYRSDSSSLPQGECDAGFIANGSTTGSGDGDPMNANDGNRSPTTTYRGYPYWHQPGRDGDAVLKPVYSFLNRKRSNGAIVHVVGDATGATWTGLQANCANNDTGRINCHFQLNRDLYQETASFDGTSGVGVGTLASRPSTCTPTPESADAGNGGVGYWATDQGSWNQSSSNSQGVQQNGADGVLYRCSATDTWTVAYTPYTYPHPLQGFAGESPATHLYGLVRATARWMEVASLITMGWHFRRQLLAGTLACAALGGAAWHGLMLTSQRTVSVGKTVLAKSIQAVIEKRGTNG